MTELKFDEIVKDRIKTIKTTLIEKGKQYRRNNSVFHNFEVGAKMTNQSREKVLYGFLLKHLISFQDIVNDIEADKLPTIETLEEKIGDICNYMILFEASVKDKLSNKMLDLGEFVSFKHTLFDLTNPLSEKLENENNIDFIVNSSNIKNWLLETTDPLNSIIDVKTMSISHDLPDLLTFNLEKAYRHIGYEVIPHPE